MRMNSRINVVQEINVKRNFPMLRKFSKVISCIRGGCAVKRIDISRVIQIIECHIKTKNITRLVISFLGFIPLTCLWLFHETISRAHFN